jgi:hypothetical protein
MSEFEQVVRRQYDRIKDDAKKPNTDVSKLLSDSAAEIRGAGTAEAIARLTTETSSALDNPITGALLGRVATARESGLYVPRQGYIGGILPGGNEEIYMGMLHLSGSSAVPDIDPIQYDCGSDFFYPPMALAKALNEAAYRTRPESARSLTRDAWAAEHDLFGGWGSVRTLTLGSFMITGATGVMPLPKFREGLDRTSTEMTEHLTSEPALSFQGSGLCDQLVVEGAHATNEGIDRAVAMQGAGRNLN